MTTIVITGRREITPSEQVAVQMSIMPELARRGVVRVVHGDAEGFDRYVARCARNLGMETVAVPAEWGRFGSYAGPERNQRMVLEWRDRAVFLMAFPGGKGTAHCVSMAKRHGLPVVRVCSVSGAPPESCLSIETPLP